MKDRRDEILDVAIRLAEEGGFDNVRQRDVAHHAGVALGTLYKSFRSKEDLLSAALERETGSLEARLAQRPVRGEQAVERVTVFLGQLTRGLLKKPNYARAVIRAMASGEPETASNVARYHDRMNRLMVAALRGESPERVIERPASTEEAGAALMLQQLWFSLLVGWSAGLFGAGELARQIDVAGPVVVRGFNLARPAGTGGLAAGDAARAHGAGGLAAGDAARVPGAGGSPPAAPRGP